MIFRGAVAGTVARKKRPASRCGAESRAYLGRTEWSCATHVAIPGPDRPDRARGGMGVLGKPEQDKIIDHKSQGSGALDSPRGLALRVSQAQELFRVKK